jgi:hypothetical protein
MPDLNDTFGSLCLIALLAPVKAGGVKSDAIRAGKCPSQLAFPVLARSCTERCACLPLLRAGLTAAQDAQTRFKKPKKSKQLDFFTGFKLGQWAYGHSVREAKKRPLVSATARPSFAPTPPRVTARCSFFGLERKMVSASMSARSEEKSRRVERNRVTCLPHAPRAVRTHAPRWPKTTPRGFRPCRTR